MVPPATTPQASPTRCVEPAAVYHGVNAEVLRAILKVESSFRADVVSRNTNGTIDVGIAQINSLHFAKLRQYKISPSDLLDPCVGTYVAAWHLARQTAAYGNTWFAIGAYHSATPVHNTRYQGLIWRAIHKMRSPDADRGTRQKVSTPAFTVASASQASFSAPSSPIIALEGEP